MNQYDYNSIHNSSLIRKCICGFCGYQTFSMIRMDNHITNMHPKNLEVKQ